MFKGDQGYTLLEVLVATALLALMAFPLVESLRVGLSAWSDSHVNAGKAERVLYARTQLRKWLSFAYPAYYQRSGEKVYPMVGDVDSLSFITPLSPDHRATAMYKVSLLLTEAGQLQALAKPDFSDDSAICSDDGTNCVAGVLLEGVEAVTFSFLDPETGEWVEEWPAPSSNIAVLQDDLPLAVRAVVQLADPELKWPELVVPVEVKEWARCQLQTSTEKQECSWEA